MHARHELGIAWVWLTDVSSDWIGMPGIFLDLPRESYCTLRTFVGKRRMRGEDVVLVLHIGGEKAERDWWA